MCGRLFKRHEHLKRHILIHTRERTYQCPICRKRFYRSDSLNQHTCIHARSSEAGAAAFGAGIFGDEDADADNEGLDYLDSDDDDFAVYASTRVVEVEVHGEHPEEGLLPSAATATTGHGTSQDLFS